MPPLAVTAAEYPAPTGALGSETVVTIRVGEIIARLNALAAVSATGLVESVTVMTGELVPRETARPETIPVLGSIARPAGKPFAAQEYGAVPPVAVTCAEYATPG